MGRPRAGSLYAAKARGRSGSSNPVSKDDLRMIAAIKYTEIGLRYFEDMQTVESLKIFKAAQYRIL